MIATIQKESEIYTARYERHFHHSVEEVWSMLTDNEKLQQWFTELQVVDLRNGGLIKFDMQDGNFIDMKILDYEAFKILAFEWGEDIARFELSSVNDGCQLTFIETISSFSEQKVKDLAGWHVCLDVIEAILDGRTIASRKDQWKAWYVKYEELLEGLRKAGQKDARSF
ncbi:SRPBCC family protein [Psychrobacillus sp. FSL H8-0483]|uniref:SRPBCC family protein n=1 Tax=Psychrobacillus sp. FSL H8-0483 TaxID=2921389 RepID=UPI00315AB047